MNVSRALVAVSVVAVSLLAAGCGGGGRSPNVANVATSTTTASTTAQGGSPQSAAFAFARCMRAHGLAWPDPEAGGGFDKAKLQQLGVSPQRVRSIEDHSCGHLLPLNGGTPAQTPQQARARLEDELSFARCMRSHGVSRFPDPTAQAGLSVEMVQAAGIDVHSPAVLRVVQTCLPASHGALTAAKVRRAIGEAHG